MRLTSLGDGQSVGGGLAHAPRVSVIVPARNAAATLAQTLDSLLAQSEPAWEALIVDDGSSDTTAAIAAAYAARDPRFTLLTGPGQGVSVARNLGIGAARGQWLHFLDADDWVAPDFFTKMLAGLRASPKALVSFCGYRRVMPGGTTGLYSFPLLAEDPFEKSARGCPVAIHAVLVDRALVVRLGGFDAGHAVGEDWDLWQRVSRCTRPWVYVADTVVYYRNDAPSLSSKVDWLLENSRVIIARGFGTDERLAGIEGAMTAPTDTARGSIHQALAYFALWTAGLDCGSGGTGRINTEMLVPFTGAGHEAEPLAGVILDGLIVGLRLLPETLADNWRQFGPALTDLVTWLGEVWNNQAAAQAIQYNLEEKILSFVPAAEPRMLNRTLGLRVNLFDPPLVTLPADAARVMATFTQGDEIKHSISIGLLGGLSRRQWLEAAFYHGATAYRPWRRHFGLAADLHFFRHAAAWALRHPRALLDRHAFRDNLRQITQRTMLSLVSDASPPNDHAAGIRALTASAAAEAARDTRAVPLPVAEPLDQQEDEIDFTRRQSHFEKIFSVEDPWNYTSPYESQKYRRQLALLPPGPIARALELACAEGHFTTQLAPLVGHLTATDIAANALDRTRVRCAAQSNIAYQLLDFAAGPIPGDMELIVCSEALYYLRNEAELRVVAGRIVAALAPGGHLVTAHPYLLKDNPNRTGFDWGTIYGVEVIHRVFCEIPGLALERSIDTELYRIDRYRRTEPGEPAFAPVVETADIVADLNVKVARAIVWGGAVVDRATALETQEQSKIAVLMYHGVSDDGPAPLARYRVNPAQFTAQMRWLRANGFYAIGSEQLELHLRTREPFPGRPVMITFDDGFQDFADNAWPILAAHDMTAEMFIVTDLVGKTAAWDADKGAPTPLMNAETIARLAAEGALFGSHLASHRPINSLSNRELAGELAGSRARLAEWTGKAPISFAAPFSITDTRLGLLARDCGYKIGLGGHYNPVELHYNPLELSRLEVRGDRPLVDFIATMKSAL